MCPRPHMSVDSALTRAGAIIITPDRFIAPISNNFSCRCGEGGDIRRSGEDLFAIAAWNAGMGGGAAWRSRRSWDSGHSCTAQRRSLAHVRHGRGGAAHEFVALQLRQSATAAMGKAGRETPPLRQGCASALAGGRWQWLPGARHRRGWTAPAPNLLCGLRPSCGLCGHPAVAFTE